ncbi:MULTISPECIES: SDR family oxidoreductase [unclassified Pseudoalteromonas]|uniref:SDR family NAD(P)-dependent oxidoreductase n=1 Tax=unclassified Pseudoalteromonas TaxID=194690 RepID=UPI0020969A1B|nr:SDR family oxidoreductase [Pseudoalteromonas sp. XMcav2-N]MCO7190822.1 SDR family oxidoreductase [Pseudoalteromonas sp. XMcav2-N]
MDLQLQDKVVLITGTSRGIGLALAQAFLAQGARVFGLCRSKDVAEELTQPNYVQFSGSVDDPEFVEATVARIIARHQRIDVLVNNAGITRDNLLQTMSRDDFNAVMQVNFVGAFSLCQAVLPHMQRAGQGRIVNLVSLSGVSGREGQANYAASKGAVIGMTRMLARRYGESGIYCNALAPALIATEMADVMPQNKARPVLAHTSLGRVGQVSEVADWVLFLATPRAGYCNGQVIKLDGGFLL